jgi:hypothetical protein
MTDGRDMMYRYRRMHVMVLGVVLVAAIVLVTVRGFDERGVTLIAVIAAFFAFRLWQFRRMEPPPK